MITLLRVVLGTGCLAVGAAFISVALRQYRRELTWRRTVGILQGHGSGLEREIAYTDHAGQRRLARHWGVSRTVGAAGAGERITILYHPRAPERITLSFGAGVLAVLTLAGIAVGLLGLWMLGNAVSS